MLSKDKDCCIYSRRGRPTASGCFPVLTAVCNAHLGKLRRKTCCCLLVVVAGEMLLL